MFFRQVTQIRWLFIAACILGISACSTLPRNPVPSELIYSADIEGMEGMRAWGGIVSESFQADIVEAFRQEPGEEFATDENGLRIYDSLLLSGGGANGAFGAGVLFGWSESGTRPVFKLVSGVSTGALIAPFAFLGPDYDEELSQVFTSVDSDDIIERYSLWTILSNSESLGSMAPLARIIDASFDAEFLHAVAEQHNRGHRLYIGTYNMDAQRLVVWNMGLIANSEHPEAPTLFRQVVLASASIPIAFPPVLMEVTAGGKTYDEMHVDGGLAAQVFFYGGVVSAGDAARTALGIDAGKFGQTGTIYVVRNGQFFPAPIQVERKLADITENTVSAMIRSSAKGDMYRIQTYATSNNFKVKYISIPEDFESESEEAFDSAEMNRLFDLGYEMVKSNGSWKSGLPGVIPGGKPNTP